MRVVLRGVLVIILIVSLAMNVVAYVKYRGTRPIMAINGQGLSKRDLDDFLEAQSGPAVKAQIAERMLTEQAATAAHLMPTQQEVDDEFNTQKELNWQFAMNITNNPWYAGEAKERIKQQLCQQRLRIKDVTITDDDLKAEYNSRPAFYDTPNKARCELALIKDPSLVKDIKQLMQDTPPVNPITIRDKYTPNVFFLGDNNVFTFVQPFGDSTMLKQIFSLKPGEVTEVPATEFATQGVKAMVVRLNEIVPGHKADLNDPKIKERLRTNVGLRKSKPWQEILSKLWADAKFESEDPRDKRYIETKLFPERASDTTQ